MELNEQNGRFLSHHQQLLFNTKLEDGKPSEKADIIRNIMFDLKTSHTTNMLTSESCDFLLKEYNNSYAGIVDSLDEGTGLNNYAEGALSICSLHKNDSQNWKSSLSITNIDKMECVRQILQSNKKILDRLVPTEYKDKVIISNATDTDQHASKQNINGQQNISIPSHRQAINEKVQALETQKPGADYGGKLFGNYPKYQQQRSNNSSGHYQRSDNTYSNNDRGDNWNEQTNRRPLFSSGTSNNSIYNSHGQQGRNQNPGPSFRRQEGGVKRPLQQDNADEWNEPPKSAGFDAFRTAKEQLNIDNQKKHGGSRSNVTTSSYGAVKKSLGTRRGPSSRFVPPVVRNKDEDDNDDVCINAVQKSIFGKSASRANTGGMGGSAGSGDGNEEPVDERLKGIEPKMIELVMNEVMDHGPNIGWDDIAGLEFAKKTIKEIVVWPMLRPDIFTGLRGPPKGLLLFGPPGTGKTLIGKCIASQSKSTFFSISASSLTSKWVGEGEKMVRALFAVARCHQPAVVFIDEIDSLLSQRSDGEHEASRRIKTEFLVQLDGAATLSEDRLLVIGATNRPQEIDEAARRRFVKRLYIPLPETAARKQIVLNLLSQQVYQLSEPELDVICSKTDGYSGADMANLCREAALGPIRSMPFGDIENITAEQVRPIEFQDFEEAFLQVRASVSDKDLNLYIEWNNMFGSTSAVR